MDSLFYSVDTISNTLRVSIKCLCISIRILNDPLYHIKYNSEAKDFIDAFIENCVLMFNPKFVSLIVHLFSHLPEQVLSLGPLDSHSAWRFENTLKTLKNKTTSFKLPLRNVTNILRSGATFVSKSTRLQDKEFDLKTVTLRHRIPMSNLFNTLVTKRYALSIASHKLEDSHFLAKDDI